MVEYCIAPHRSAHEVRRCSRERSGDYNTEGHLPQTAVARRRSCACAAYLAASAISSASRRAASRARRSRFSCTCDRRDAFQYAQQAAARLPCRCRAACSRLQQQFSLPDTPVRPSGGIRQLRPDGAILRIATISRLHGSQASSIAPAGLRQAIQRQLVCSMEC